MINQSVRWNKSFIFRLENTVFTGFEVTSNRIFLATPRLRDGVPATLSTIPRNTPPGSSPVLSAYPDWSLHGAIRGDLNCTGLISVYRIRADSCNRLWVGRYLYSRCIKTTLSIEFHATYTQFLFLMSSNSMKLEKLQTKGSVGLAFSSM